MLLLQSSATGLAPGRRRLVQRHLSKKGPMDKEAFFVECVFDEKLPLPVRKLLLALKCEKDAAVVEKDLAVIKLTNEKDLAVVRLTREKNAMAVAKDLAMIEKDFDMQQLELAINNLMFPTSVLNPCALFEFVGDKLSYLYSGPLTSWPALFLPDHPKILARVRFPQRPRRVHKNEESLDSRIEKLFKLRYC